MNHDLLLPQLAAKKLASATPRAIHADLKTNRRLFSS
jgi:hypothetical protein